MGVRNLMGYLNFKIILKMMFVYFVVLCFIIVEIVDRERG